MNKALAKYMLYSAAMLMAAATSEALTPGETPDPNGLNTGSKVALGIGISVGAVALLLCAGSIYLLYQATRCCALGTGIGLAALETGYGERPGKISRGLMNYAAGV